MNEDCMKNALALMTEAVGDIYTTALLWRAGDSMADELLVLADRAYEGEARPLVVAVGGIPRGDWPLARADDRHISQVLHHAGIKRLLTTSAEIIPLAELLPPKLLSYLALQNRIHLPNTEDSEALFERMRSLGYL
jgi:hypothetical protein